MKQNLKDLQKECFLVIENCIADIRRWMNINFLKLNNSKTEFIVIRNRQQLSKIDHILIHMGNTDTQLTEFIRSLSFFMDKLMKNGHHINIITSHWFSILRNIRGIRPYLDIETTKTIIQALILPWTDYCNSLLEGSTDYQLTKLQRIIIYNLRKYDHITEHMWDLHWLWVPERIIYKVALLMFKVLNDLAPGYLCRLINKKSHSRRLQSITQYEDRNIQPISYRTLQALHLSFAARGPKNWISLPKDLKAERDIMEFKKKLKTHPFEWSYGNR